MRTGMSSDTHGTDNDTSPPTEEIYIELSELEAEASKSSEASEGTAPTEPVPALSEDDPAGPKARIARLRAILSDRGALPPD